ncbi:MAG: metallophosphoesterase [Hyphomicrobiaceae bacterium]
MLSRRHFLQGVTAFAASGLGLGGYAFAVEPNRMRVQTWRVEIDPARWPRGLRLRIAVLADLHAGGPWMTGDRIAAIVAQTNDLAPDIVVLLGDYVATHRFLKPQVPHHVWAGALSRLDAPLGRYAVLGNHDWWDSRAVQAAMRGPTPAGEALRGAGIPVLENDALRLTWNGHPFWLLGLGDQWAFYGQARARGGPAPRAWSGYQGVDDLPATLDQITDDAPAILLAHEPDIFPDVPDRVALTISGHTHGGQVQFLGWAPIVPSRYRQRYLYGLITETQDAIEGAQARHIVVSAGLGCSGLPVRFGRPPEITIIELEATALSA